MCEDLIERATPTSDQAEGWAKHVQTFTSDRAVPNNAPSRSMTLRMASQHGKWREKMLRPIWLARNCMFLIFHNVLALGNDN